jgi:hypothetical protein
MFVYSDPTGGNFGDNDQVRTFFQQTMQGFYDSFGSRRNSGFTWIEAFDQLAGGQQPTALIIDWRSFPLLASGSLQEIDSNRLMFQDEYVEWLTESDTSGSPARITFITELPEYLQAFAAVGLNELSAAIQAVIPGAVPTAGEL